MAFEEKIEKYSTPGSTTKIREQRANYCVHFEYNNKEYIRL